MSIHRDLARRIVQYHRESPISALLGWAAVALLIYTLV
jgi:hypothetical protein